LNNIYVPMFHYTNTFYPNQKHRYIYLYESLAFKVFERVTKTEMKFLEIRTSDSWFNYNGRYITENKPKEHCRRKRTYLNVIYVCWSKTERSTWPDEHYSPFSEEWQQKNIVLWKLGNVSNNVEEKETAQICNVWHIRGLDTNRNELP